MDKELLRKLRAKKHLSGSRKKARWPERNIKELHWKLGAKLRKTRFSWN